MGRTGRIISALIIAGFISILTETGISSLPANTHPYVFLLLHLTPGFLVVAFLVVIYQKQNKHNNVIRPHQRRHQSSRWFEELP